MRVTPIAIADLRHEKTQFQYNFYTMPAFELDSHESASNLARHGIDFDAAKSLWNDPDLIEIPARTDDEPRALLIGRLRGKHWAAIITCRGDPIRLISVRRARHEEVVLYESQVF